MVWPIERSEIFLYQTQKAAVYVSFVSGHQTFTSNVDFFFIYVMFFAALAATPLSDLFK